MTEEGRMANQILSHIAVVKVFLGHAWNAVCMVPVLADLTTQASSRHLLITIPTWVLFPFRLCPMSGFVQCQDVFNIRMCPMSGLEYSIIEARFRIPY